MRWGSASASSPHDSRQRPLAKVEEGCIHWPVRVEHVTKVVRILLRNLKGRA